ncbi:cupin domain-containing protein [Phenylobacterium montanum]|uniref:Cupin domain-containing protein n=1 Tax=Phenylobacterium montanum TaxID=2823693 RepID=A0A975G328_9CAUL|nr:cupin domain-containing protein [Caulobacter sp. S6]QUD89111.1 cupin domain-containing protein [Caulobacter sp. S6]
MTAKLIRIPGQAEPVTEPVAPDRLLEGHPVTETRNAYEKGEHTYVGEWAAGEGAWRVAYDEWEFCHILSGVCELVPDDGEAMRFCAGDSFVIEPGFAGVWRVLEPMRKRYVIRLGE